MDQGVLERLLSGEVKHRDYTRDQHLLPEDRGKGSCQLSASSTLADIQSLDHSSIADSGRDVSVLTDISMLSAESGHRISANV